MRIQFLTVVGQRPLVNAELQGMQLVLDPLVVCPSISSGTEATVQVAQNPAHCSFFWNDSLTLFLFTTQQNIHFKIVNQHSPFARYKDYFSKEERPFFLKSWSEQILQLSV